MLHTLLAENFATIMIIIFLMIFIKTNHSFDKNTNRLFLIFLYSLITLLVADGVETYTSTLLHPSLLRVIVSAIGYSLRPFLIFLGIPMLFKDKTRHMFFLAFPALVNTLISFSALFSGIMFSYDENNEFVRGPLGFSTYFFCGLYVVILVCFAINKYKDSNREEFTIVVAIGLLATLSAILESIWGFSGFINTALAITVSFYYLFLHIQQFKRDILTNTLNRRSFYLDADKYGTNITAVVSIDLNNLKQINDTFGHAAGDIAICSLVSSVKKNLLKGCTIYRTGGDEFIILCCQKTKAEVEKMLANITATMNETDYSFAMGVAFCEKNIPFDKTCIKADEEMYKNKCSQKSSS